MDFGLTLPKTPKSAHEAIVITAAPEFALADGAPVTFTFHNPQGPRGRLAMQRFGKLFARNSKAQDELALDASDAELDAAIEADEAVGRRMIRGLLKGWSLPVDCDEAAVEVFLKEESYGPLIADITGQLLEIIRQQTEARGKTSA